MKVKHRIQVGETQLEQVIPELEKNGITGCLEEPSVSWAAFHCGGLDVQVATDTNVVNGVWFKPQVSISLADSNGYSIYERTVETSPSIPIPTATASP